MRKRGFGMSIPYGLLGFRPLGLRLRESFPGTRALEKIPATFKTLTSTSAGSIRRSPGRGLADAAGRSLCGELLSAAG